MRLEWKGPQEGQHAKTRPTTEPAVNRGKKKHQGCEQQPPETMAPEPEKTEEHRNEAAANKEVNHKGTLSNCDYELGA